MIDGLAHMGGADEVAVVALTHPQRGSRTCRTLPGR